MSSNGKERSFDVYVLPTDCPMDKKTKNSFWHINKEMLRFKLHFFLYLSGIAFAVPYIVVFAKDRVGISASSLGGVLTAQMFLFIFTKPMIGYVADYFNRLKTIITVLTVITGTCYCLLLTIPNYEIQQSGQGNQTYLDSPSGYIADLDLCQKHRNLLHVTADSANFANSSLSETEDTLARNQVFVVCFRESGDTLSCLKRCSYFRETDKTPNENESKSFCDIIFFSDPQFFNDSDCSVKCIWDESFPCHTANNASSPIECMELICLQRDTKVSRAVPTSTGALSDCIYFENLENLCSDETDVSIEPNDNISNGVSKSHEQVSDYTTYQFWIFTVLFTIASVSSNAIFTLSDTACCETIQRTGGEFGQQRLWGAIGWGTSAPLAGFINDYTGGFLASWVIMNIMFALFLLNISKLDLVKPHFSKNILKDVGTVFKSREFLAFEVSVLMNGFGTGMIWFYLVWFLTSIGGSKLLCGLSLTVQSGLGVIPFMFFSGWIIRKVGHFNVLTMSLAAYFVRFLWYSYLYNPWLVLPVEVVHGLSYGLYYTALASYGKMSAKPGTEATTQAIIFSTNEGLGAGLGCVIGGLGFDTIGGHKTFYYFSVFSACGVVISLISSILVDNRRKDMKVTTSTEVIHPTQDAVFCSKYKKTPLEF